MATRGILVIGNMAYRINYDAGKYAKRHFQNILKTSSPISAKQFILQANRRYESKSRMIDLDGVPVDMWEIDPLWDAYIQYVNLAKKTVNMRAVPYEPGKMGWKRIPKLR